MKVPVITLARLDVFEHPCCAEKENLLPVDDDQGGVMLRCQVCGRLWLKAKQGPYMLIGQSGEVEVGDGQGQAS